MASFSRGGRLRNQQAIRGGDGSGDRPSWLVQRRRSPFSATHPARAGQGHCRGASPYWLASILLPAAGGRRAAPSPIDSAVLKSAAAGARRFVRPAPTAPRSSGREGRLRWRDARAWWALVFAAPGADLPIRSPPLLSQAAQLQLHPRTLPTRTTLEENGASSPHLGVAPGSTSTKLGAEYRCGR